MCLIGVWRIQVGSDFHKGGCHLEEPGLPRTKLSGHLLPVLFALGIGAVSLVYAVFWIIETSWLVAAPMDTVHLLHAIRGIVAAGFLGVLVAWYLVRSGGSVFSVTKERVPSPIEPNRLRLHASWFIDLRWFAVMITGALVLIIHTTTHILPHETFAPLFATVLLLAAANVVFKVLLGRPSTSHYRLIIAQVLVDLVGLTLLLHLSGGVENPLFLLYSFHVIIASILLGKREGYLFACVACVLFGAQATGELTGAIPHYTVQLFPHGAQHADARDHGHEETHTASDEEIPHAAHNPLYVLGRYASFVVVLFGTAYFIGLIMDYVRQNEDDLSEMARAASAEHERLESLAHAVGAGLVLVDRAGTIRWYNRRIKDWFDWGDDRVGMAASDQSGPDIESLLNDVLRSGVTQELEWNAGERVFRVSVSPVRSPEGEVVQHAALVQDVTERKTLEAQMMHVEKMASLGQMSAGIVHEIGNPLSSLSTRLRLMESRKDSPGFIEESVNLLEGQIDRIQRIVRGVSQFSRVPHEAWVACRVDDVLNEVIEILKMDRRARGIEIRSEIGALDETVAVRDQLTQVFLNLGLNALEALPERGRLSIGAEQERNRILVQFEDDGPGIPENVMPRLFDPFFTTKEQGSGLGLFICQNIVDAHGGRIDLQSEADRGSRFTVSFPVRVRPVTPDNRAG